MLPNSGALGSGETWRLIATPQDSKRLEEGNALGLFDVRRDVQTALHTVRRQRRRQWMDDL